MADQAQAASGRALTIEAAHPKIGGLTGGSALAIVPQTFDDVWRFSQVLAASGLCPYGMNTPEKVSVAIMTGLELGVPPMQAVQSIAVINGRPTIWGDLVLALVYRTGELEYLTETYEGTPPVDWTRPKGEELNYKAVCRLKRRGFPEIYSEFSVGDAMTAKLWMKRGGQNGDKDTPWVTNPKRMMKMRARSFGIRDGFADVTRGLYIREEVEDDVVDERERPPAPPPAPAPAKRSSRPSAPPAPPPAKTEVVEDAVVTEAKEDTKPVEAAKPAQTAAPSAQEREPVEDSRDGPADGTSEGGGLTLEEQISELKDRLAFATTEEAVEEAYSDFDAEAVLSEYTGGVEAARAALAEARRRVAARGERVDRGAASSATVEEKPPEETEPVNPFTVPAGLDEAGYVAWADRLMAATTSHELAPKAVEAWKGSGTLRSEIMKADAAKDLTLKVRAHLDSLAPPEPEKPATKPRTTKPKAAAPTEEAKPAETPAADPPAASDAGPTPFDWAPDGMGFVRPAKTVDEYLQQANLVLNSKDGDVAYAWWVSQTNVRDKDLHPWSDDEHQRIQKMKLLFVAKRNDQRRAKENE